jgi:hypothetical protein
MLVLRQVKTNRDIMSSASWLVNITMYSLCILHQYSGAYRMEGEGSSTPVSNVTCGTPCSTSPILKGEASLCARRVTCTHPECGAACLLCFIHCLRGWQTRAELLANSSHHHGAWLTRENHPVYHKDRTRQHLASFSTQHCTSCRRRCEAQ